MALVESREIAQLSHQGMALEPHAHDQISHGHLDPNCGKKSDQVPSGFPLSNPASLRHYITT